MSDSRTLSARKTLYLDAPVVSIQTGPDPRGLEVGGLPLGNWEFGTDVTYGTLIADTPGSDQARFVRTGRLVTLSLPTFPLTNAIAATNTLTVTLADAIPFWAQPIHEGEFSSKIYVAGVSAGVSIVMGTGSVQIILDSNAAIGNSIFTTGLFVSYIGSEVPIDS